VKLCDDSEYAKYKRLQQNVEIFVNHKGEVRCRSLRVTENSRHRIAFATADAYIPHRTPVDEEGYPVFQGTRGIRCRIHGIQDLRRSNYSDMMTTMSDLTPDERKAKKNSLFAKIGIGIAVAGVAASVLALVSFTPSSSSSSCPLPCPHLPYPPPRRVFWILQMEIVRIKIVKIAWTPQPLPLIGGEGIEVRRSI
jgi:hypothetical protein